MSTLWTSLIGWFAVSKPPSLCDKEFPQVYSSFVDHLIDTLHAQGPTSPQACVSEDIKSLPTPPLRLPAVERLVAIGDLHGDFEKTRQVFKTAGLIDDAGRWSGGNTTAVQVGDQLDRGDNEVQLLYFLERLQKEAAAQGGALHILTGNHETMNVAGRFRYATDTGLDDFASYTFMHSMAAALKANCGCRIETPAVPPPVSRQSPAQSRAAALSPGGPATRRFLAPHPVVLQVGSTMFVHGALLPQHIEYGLERMNAETRAWMLGQGPSTGMPSFLGGRDAVVWARDFSQEDARRCDCKLLEESLGMLPGAERMVVGHTIQGAGINPACGNRVYRIDVGLSHGCGDGEPEAGFLLREALGRGRCSWTSCRPACKQVLEVINDKEVRSLREGRPAKPFTSGQPEADSPSWAWWQRARRKAVYAS